MYKYYVNGQEVDKDTYDKAVADCEEKMKFNEIFDIFGFGFDLPSIKKELIEHEEEHCNEPVPCDLDIDDEPEDNCDDECPMLSMMAERIQELQDEVAELKERNEELSKAVTNVGSIEATLHDLKQSLQKIESKVPQVIYLPVYSHPDLNKSNWWDGGITYNADPIKTDFTTTCSSEVNNNTNKKWNKKK